MKEKTQPKPYPLRMAEDLKAWVQARAQHNDRSMNAELNRLIRQVMCTQRVQDEIKAATGQALEAEYIEHVKEFDMPIEFITYKEFAEEYPAYADMDS